MVPVPGRSVRDEAGFTLLELLVVMVIFGFMLAVSVPALSRFTHRANLEQAARQTEELMQLARREAIKSNVNANVAFDYDSNQVYAYADTNANNVEDAGEKELGRFPLPKQVFFWGGEDATAKGAHAVITWGTTSASCTGCPNGGIAAFLPSGGISTFGADPTACTVSTGCAVHLGDKKDSSGNGNFLEVKVATPLTGKLELRKYNKATGTYLLRDENGTPWTWY